MVFIRNGTTHILFSPLDFLSKLAALVPRPRHNLARYHGVLARGCRQPNARMRKLIVPTKRKKTNSKVDQNQCKSIAKSESADELIAPLTWAQRLKRVFNIDISVCPLCGGTTRVIGRSRLRIIDPDIIQKILDHIEAQPPPLSPATGIQS